MPTESLHFTVSGEIVIMAVIGSFGTVVGPVIGAAIVHGLENARVAITDPRNRILGVIFMSFVIVFGGVMSLLRRLGRLFGSSSNPSQRRPNGGGQRHS